MKKLTLQQVYFQKPFRNKVPIDCTFLRCKNQLMNSVLVCEMQNFVRCGETTMFFAGFIFDSLIFAKFHTFSHIFAQSPLFPHVCLKYTIDIQPGIRGEFPNKPSCMRHITFLLVYCNCKVDIIITTEQIYTCLKFALQKSD